ncbi:MAG: putative membrane protein [Pseudomonadales bacterium]|jgi:uncharacterized membrane protein
MTVIEKKAFVSYWVLVVCYIDILVLFTVKTLIWPSADREPNLTIWLFHMIPMLPFLPGLIKKNHRHYVGLCYITIVYFMSSGGNLFNENVHIYDWLTVVLCVLIYISGLLAARWQKQVEAQKIEIEQTVDSSNE